MRKSLNLHPFEKKKKINKVGFISSLENKKQISESKSIIPPALNTKPVKYIKNGKVKLLKCDTDDIEMLLHHISNRVPVKAITMNP